MALESEPIDKYQCIPINYKLDTCRYVSFLNGDLKQAKLGIALWIGRKE